MYPAGRNQKLNKNHIPHNVIDIYQENFSLGTALSSRKTISLKN
jgi:hypothetical protein